MFPTNSNYPALYPQLSNAGSGASTSTRPRSSTQPATAPASQQNTHHLDSLLRSFNMQMPTHLTSDPESQVRLSNALQTLTNAPEVLGYGPAMEFEPAVRNMLENIHQSAPDDPRAPPMREAACELFRLRVLDARTQRKEVIAELFLWTLDNQKQTMQPARPATADYSDVKASDKKGKAGLDRIMKSQRGEPPPASAPTIMDFNSQVEVGKTAIEVEMRSYRDCVDSKDKYAREKAKTHLNNVKSMVENYARDKGDKEDWLKIAASDFAKGDERMWKALVTLSEGKFYDFNAQDRNGRTALHRDCTKELVNLLLREASVKEKVDFFKLDTEKRTPLFYAQDGEAAQALLNYAGKNAKDEVNRMDKEKNTPLHHAALNQKPAVAQSLCSVRGFKDVKNQTGKTAGNLVWNLAYQHELGDGIPKAAEAEAWEKINHLIAHYRALR